MITANCEYCGAEFAKRVYNKKYCGTNCWETAIGKQPLTRGYANNTTGRISEYIVTTDLLKKGLNVYIASSPSSPSDLVVEIGGKLLAVEVRTSHRSKVNGKFYHNMGRLRSDILAAVIIQNSEIVYSAITASGSTYLEVLNG